MVLDTTVLISAFAFGGTPAKAVRKALTEADIYVSPDLLAEYRDVPLALRSRRKIDHEQLKALISGIAAFVAEAKVVRPRKRFAVCGDPADNILLDCCFEAKAHVLVTGDKGLLKLKDLPFSLDILSPRKYLDVN